LQGDLLTGLIVSSKTKEVWKCLEKMELDPKAKVKEPVGEEAAAIPGRKERGAAAGRARVAGTGTGRAKAVGKEVAEPKAAVWVPDGGQLPLMKRLIIG
jgi:hypothetical protein